MTTHAVPGRTRPPSRAFGELVKVETKLAAVQAMEAAMQGHFPPIQPLLVMAAYAVAFGIAAIRLFRWE